MPQNQVDWASLAQQWIAMKDSMPPEPPVPPQISGPPHGGGDGGPGHHHQQHMPPHSMPAPPPPPSINQHHLHHQASRDMSDHGHDSYDQHHDNYEDEGGMANMDLEEPEEASYHGNHRPMPDVYHTARRHPNSPHPPGQYLPKHIHEQNKQRNFYQRQNSMGGPPGSGSWNNQHPGQFGGNSSHQHMMQDDPNAGP